MGWTAILQVALQTLKSGAWKYLVTGLLVWVVTSGGCIKMGSWARELAVARAERKCRRECDCEGTDKPPRKRWIFRVGIEPEDPAPWWASLYGLEEEQEPEGLQYGTPTRASRPTGDR